MVCALSLLPLSTPFLVNVILSVFRSRYPLLGELPATRRARSVSGPASSDRKFRPLCCKQHYTGEGATDRSLPRSFIKYLRHDEWVALYSMNRSAI